MINWVVDLNWHHTDLDPNRNNSENQSNDSQTLWPTHVSLVCSCPPFHWSITKSIGMRDSLVYFVLSLHIICCCLFAFAKRPSKPHASIWHCAVLCIWPYGERLNARLDIYGDETRAQMTLAAAANNTNPADDPNRFLYYRPHLIIISAAGAAKTHTISGQSCLNGIKYSPKKLRWLTISMIPLQLA